MENLKIIVEKLQQGKPLTKTEREEVIEALQKYLSWLSKRQVIGEQVKDFGKLGGRPRDENPSPSAVYQRELRERKKNENSPA